MSLLLDYSFSSFEEIFKKNAYDQNQNFFSFHTLHLKLSLKITFVFCFSCLFALLLKILFVSPSIKMDVKMWSEVKFNMHNKIDHVPEQKVTAPKMVQSSSFLNDVGEK